MKIFGIDCGCEERKEKLKGWTQQMAQNSSFGLSAGTPTVAGALAIGALLILVALRMGFRGVVIKMGK